jgi:hypothetical protein
MGSMNAALVFGFTAIVPNLGHTLLIIVVKGFSSSRR